MLTRRIRFSLSDRFQPAWASGTFTDQLTRRYRGTVFARCCATTMGFMTSPQDLARLVVASHPVWRRIGRARYVDAMLTAPQAMCESSRRQQPWIGSLIRCEAPRYRRVRINYQVSYGAIYWFTRLGACGPASLLNWDECGP